MGSESAYSDRGERKGGVAKAVGTPESPKEAQTEPYTVLVPALLLNTVSFDA